MKSVKELVEEFKQRAIEHYKYGMSGNYRQVNKNVKKINIIYEVLKKENGLSELLILVDSDIPEVASLAATYCLSYYPDKCLSVFEKLAQQNIPLISMEVEYAIKNWKDGNWNIS